MLIRLSIILNGLLLVALVVSLRINHVNSESSIPVSHSARTAIDYAASGARISNLAKEGDAKTSESIAPSWRRADIRYHLDSLRRDGAPPKVLYYVALAILDPEMKRRREEVSRDPALPRWEQALGRLTPEQKKAIALLNDERDSEIRSLLGEDYSAAISSLNSSPYKPVYGDISPEHRTAVEQIYNDYMAALKEAGSNQLSLRGQNEIELKIWNEIVAIAGEKAANDFMAFNSTTAKTLQAGLYGITGLDDSSYLAIFNAYRQFRSGLGADLASKSPRGDMSEDYRIGELDAIAKSAPPSATLQYISKRNVNFSELSAIYNSAGFTPEASIGKYRAFLTSHRDLMNLSAPAPGQTADEFRSLRAGAAAQAYAILSSGLTGVHLQIFAASRTGRGLLYTASRK
jgi:hypothetical protein